jgi:astacin
MDMKREGDMSNVCGCGESLRGPDVKAGIAWIGLRMRSVMYTEVNGDAIVEGCIILDRAHVIERRTKGLGPDSFGVGVEPKYLWDNRRVPFRILDVPDAGRVRDAIAHWEAKTSIRFVERKENNANLYPDFVSFRNGPGCSSSVGCQRSEQFINLSAACSTGNVIHEIGHTIGLFHEQSRADRDTHVEIHYENIDPLYRHNFNQAIKDGKDIGSYDFGSIMHYPTDAFSMNGNPTIVPKTGTAIGQRIGLSDGDIETVAALYEAV